MQHIEVLGTPGSPYTRKMLAFWQDLQLDTERAKQSSQVFADRQISRLYVVGSSDLTAPVIESSYQRLVSIMDRIVQRSGFVMRSRPGACDFALYGQRKSRCERASRF